MAVVSVIVGYTTQRPLIPDQHYTAVVVAADTEVEAELIALQMVCSRRDVVMATSREVVKVVL